MLRITVPLVELFDEEKNEFSEDGFVLELEHSLVSLSKWESKYERPFLDPTKGKTDEETLDYIKCMVLTPDVPDDVFEKFSQKNVDDIDKYMNSKMSGTSFPNVPTPDNRVQEIISAELVYYWMFALGIPIECEHWHLNRLFTLIRVFNVKSSKPRQMKGNAAAEQRRALNEQRKAQLGTRG